MRLSIKVVPLSAMATAPVRPSAASTIAAGAGSACWHGWHRPCQQIERRIGEAIQGAQQRANEHRRRVPRKPIERQIRDRISKRGPPEGGEKVVQGTIGGKR